MQKAFDLEEENKEKIKVTSLEIIVTGTKEKPYFVIKYKEVGEEDYHIGYGSFDLNYVFGWKEECFEIVNQVAETYEQEVCEWKWGIDYAHVQCRGDKILFGSRRLFDYCPYCGKKIKVIGD